MPRRAQAITVTELKALSKRPGRHSIGDGLILVVRESGARSWLARIRGPKGKRNDIGLGPYPEVSLHEAREAAAGHRKVAREGDDPVKVKKEAARRTPTFKEAAEAVFVERAGGYRNAIHKKQWIGSLREYAYPTLGGLPVDEVDGPAVVTMLKPIWSKVPETARRVLQRTATVIAWSAAHGHREHELPVRAIRMGLPPQPKKNRHHDAVPVEDAPAIFARIAAGEGVSYACLQFLILTASRSNEARGALWSEVDLEARTWTVPASRMKAAEPHVVALSQRAIDLLKAQVRVAPNEQFVFPGLKEGKSIVDAALSKVMRSFHPTATVHGWRSTFRDWAAERTNYPGEVAEAALAHTIRNKVEAAYRRTKYLDRRRDLMADWTRFLESSEG